MIYTVKDIKNVGLTKKGGKFSQVILTDGKDDYAVTIFDKEIMKGDKVDGVMGEYNDKFNNYKFKVNSIQRTANSVKGTSDDERQSNIAFESFYASTCQLFSGKGEIGKAIAVTVQLHHYLTTGEWIMLATPEQIKSIVGKFGSLEIARGIVWEKYHIPYLHLLTYQQAQEVLSEG